MVKILYQSSKLILCLFTFLLIASNNCQAREHLKDLDSLKGLKFNRHSVLVTAPYSLLEHTKYTTNLDTFEFGHYTFKIINKEIPEKFIVEVTKNSKKSLAKQGSKNFIERLPWWSKSAPAALKSLDFSNVDGKLNEYRISENYQLKLLGKQGAWGKVYVLEHLKNGSKPTKICAVKLLLTREDRAMDTNIFRQRHIDEIKNNFVIADNNIDISVKPYGMLRNDDDHYLVFLEYGQSAHDVFKHQSMDVSNDALYELILNINKLHLAGYAHGDLNVRNMLFFNTKIKLCDWFSLNNFKNIDLKKYRYIGDNLPPEAMRALYFGDNDNLLYSIVTDQGQKRSYILHPIAADRFCLGISLLEIIAPDLYEKYDTLNTKGFNPWRPNSLDFWEKHVDYINSTQSELLRRASKTDNWKLIQLYKQASQFISLDPMKRNFILTETDNNPFVKI